MENLENIIEGILFYSGDAVEKNLLIEKLEINSKELDKAIENLEKKYDDNSGIKLIKFKDKLQFSTNSKYGETIDIVLKKTREKALSKVIIETAAIIAYKQPITRLEIETIRGGAPADYAIRALLEHKLIEVVGRKEALGRPLLFGTTDEFLKRFNLESLAQLPDYNELISQIEELHKTTEKTNLYNDFDVSDEAIISQENFADTIKENNENIEKINSYKLNKEEIESLQKKMGNYPENDEENFENEDYDADSDEDISDNEEDYVDYTEEDYKTYEPQPDDDEDEEDSSDYSDDDDFLDNIDIKVFKR